MKLICLDDFEVVCGALTTLAALLKKHATGDFVRLLDNLAFGPRLLSLARGWGGRQEGLSLLYCCQDHLAEKVLSHYSIEPL